MKRYLVALTALFALVLSGCSATPTLTPGSVVQVAEIGSLKSLNADVITDAASQHMASELGNLTTLSFYSLDGKGQLAANKKFGTVKVLSTVPFVVEYKLRDGLKWSDGQPVNAADLMLSFAAATNASGVSFNSVRQTSGLQYAKVQKMSELSVTLSFSQAVADYKTALTVGVPAHIVANAGLEGIEYSAGKQAVISAIEGGDKPRLEALAAAYSSVYDITKSAPAQGALVGDGPYLIDTFARGTAATLKANEKFAAGHAPTIETVVVRFYADSTAAISAMYSGEVDIINATESGLARLNDIISLVAALPEGTAKTKIRNGDSADCMLLNFGSDSIFSDAKWPNHADRADLLRKAMMNLIPKARAVQLANADYEVSQADSFIFPSSSSYYSATKVANGSQDYLIQDVEKASELVDQSGVNTPLELRVVFDRTNPRSKAQFGLIADRAASAGFEVVDLSAQDMNEVLTSGEFDLYIGPMSLTGISGNTPARILGGITSYQDTKVASLLSSYALANKEVSRAEILRKIDKRLFETNYGMPIIEVPNLMIYSTRLKTYASAAYGNSATWGYWTWSVSVK